MTLSKVPSYTKGRINKAGEILVINETDSVSQDILREWRACHAYPINTFQATLRNKTKKLNIRGEILVAQRLKRMPTIIDKLKRHPGMKLSRMQDIGGVRVVVESIKDVKKIEDAYKTKSQFSRFQHILVRSTDYIICPKPDTGYRSIHLIYSYKNRVAPEYEGLLLEMQIRTKLQHNWATAVETMGVYLNQSLKSSLGKKEWLDFFALVSSAFAHIENLPLVPRFSHLSKQETFIAVARLEKKLNALDKLIGFASSMRVIGENEANRFYHVIILDSEKKQVELQSFAQKKFNNAKLAYAAAERRAMQNDKIEPVLVAAGSIRSLKRAYPNFFLDTRDFVDKIKDIISKSSK